MIIQHVRAIYYTVCLPLRRVIVGYSLCWVADRLMSLHTSLWRPVTWGLAKSWLS